ncbi:DUF192 domain-containing protein [Candidatus Woesearchaeota archaeon]|nr:DUF192 domain-containing protein [Candidatus Woesearchaeota archaeon]
MGTKMPKIRNVTRGTTISSTSIICKSIFRKARGLMFSSQKTLIFEFSDERIIPLHMMFVFFPIEVLFVGRDKKVAEIKESFMPWSFYTPKKKACYVIELESGLIRRSMTMVGDKLKF